MTKVNRTDLIAGIEDDMQPTIATFTVHDEMRMPAYADIIRADRWEIDTIAAGPIS